MNKYKMLCAGAAMITMFGAVSVSAYANDTTETIKATCMTQAQKMSATKLNDVQLMKIVTPIDAPMTDLVKVVKFDSQEMDTEIALTDLDGNAILGDELVAAIEVIPASVIAE